MSPSQIGTTSWLPSANYSSTPVSLCLLPGFIFVCLLYLQYLIIMNFLNLFFCLFPN